MAVLNLNVPDNKFESNVQMKSKSFGIGDVSAIIDILRNRMYSRPIQTLVQEYICNARDAMIEAGTNKTHKLSIIAPTKLACEFRVRDFGIGLSEERVQNVFTMYGASTKRNTNGQIGGYGLGAKSAWAYTDSFTVVSYYEGTKTTYLCHVGRDNIGSMDILNQESTTQKNGVEIIVTVKPADVDSFQTAVRRCIMFWDRNTIDVNIQVPNVQATFGSKAFEEDNIVVFEAVNSFNSAHKPSDLIVVEGVQFESPIYFSAASRLCVFLKTGDVDIAPSRESIIDNDKVKLLATKVKAKIKSLQDKIENEKDISTKLELALKYKSILGMNDIKVDNIFSIVSGGSFFRVADVNFIRRYSNKNGGVTYDKADKVHSSYQSHALDKSTFVIIADDTVTQVRRRLEHHFSTRVNKPTSKLKYNLTSYVVCLKNKSDMPSFLLDKLTVIEASQLPVPSKVKVANAKPIDSVKEIQYSKYKGDLCSIIINAGNMVNSNAIKVPYINYSSNQKLLSVVRNNSDLKVYALTKDDFESSSLPTLDEYTETKAVEERKKIGFVTPSLWQKISKEFPHLISHNKWGTPPDVLYLNEDEVKEHRKQENKLKDSIDNLISKFPLAVVLSTRDDSLLKEVITYIKLKEAV
jgi:hypothetical protein